MTSLCNRLVAALLLSMTLCWVIWMGFNISQMSRQQTGMWDASLREVGNQILLSMPGSLASLAHNPSYQPFYTLPPSESPGVEDLTYQVWNLAERTLLLRSPGAPQTPLVPSFAQGLNHPQGDPDGWRIYSVSDAGGEIQVQVGKSRAQLHKDLDERISRALMGAVLTFVLQALAVGLVVRATMRPLDRLQRTLSRRDALDMTELPVQGLPRELHPFVASVNRLLQRLQQALRKEQSFLADAAHELRTPLAALTAQAEVARGAATLPESRAALDKLLAVARRSARLAEQLLDQARLEDQDAAAPLQPVPLHRVTNLVVRDFESAARGRSQHVTLHIEACTVAGRVDDLGVLLRNLLDNAVRYAGAGGRIEVRCRPLEGGGTLLSVADDGPGVPAQERERIFDRFYRAAGTGERGSGLGLAMVARIAARHGASIATGNGLEGRGLCVALSFPGQEGPAAG